MSHRQTNRTEAAVTSAGVNKINVHTFPAAAADGEEAAFFFFLHETK